MAKFDWRREDTVYAAATTLAAAFVAFLVAGTFGLVQSPFGSATIGQPAPVTALAAQAGTASPEPTPEEEATAASTPPPAGTPGEVAGDRSAPLATITSEPGPSATLVEGAAVTGIARDDASGVRDVVVVFEDSLGQNTSVTAQLQCDDQSRMSCTWSAKVPGPAGGYAVTAHAVDRAGNIGPGDAQQITVVNVGGPVEDLLGGVVGLLG